MKFINVLLLMLVSSIVCADSIHVFENKTVGIKVTKPTDWQFVTAEENLENIKK